MAGLAGFAATGIHNVVPLRYTWGMGREIKRVPLDFDWPLSEVWQGFLSPNRFTEDPCPDCTNGYSVRGKYLHDLWYGYVPFKPEDNGSTPLTSSTPEVRAFAERNVRSAPEFYGRSQLAILDEALRLARLWNGMWSHHLNADDVAALVEAGRLMDFTHTFSPETRWQKIEPPVMPTPEQVNAWSIQGLGHDSINAMIAIRARCEREGVSDTCGTCDGHGSLEAYEGQRAEADAWKPDEPPAGEGWQMWETVSEGSPVSPVFATAEDLAQWLTTPAAVESHAVRQPMTISQARGFVGEGWAPTGIGNASGYHDGAEYIGTEAALRDADG